MSAAPYAADTRAKGWRFEIDTEKVKASDTWLRARTGAVKGALLLLWSEAWQQTPCGSLPNDDELVALLIDMPLPTFAKHRAVLMRGWTPADDGRLYHETITARVLAMLEKRAKDAKRTAERRGRAAESGESPAEVAVVSRVTPALPASEFDTKHQAPSTSSKKKTPSPSAPRFAIFWKAYPKKVAKDAARKAFEKREVDDSLLSTMLDAICAQSRSEGWQKDGGQFIPHPSTWLNEGRWQDEGVALPSEAPRPTYIAPPPMTAEEREASDAARKRVMAARQPLRQIA